MKSIITNIFFTVIFCDRGICQSNNLELGVRLGYVASVDLAFSLKSNRIHSNMGWGIDYWLFDNCYDFQIPLVCDRWILYFGPGLGLRYWDKIRSKHSGFGLATVGEVGIEHRFIRPISIGIDWSPFYDFIKSEYNNYGTLCLRYRF